MSQHDHDRHGLPEGAAGDAVHPIGPTPAPPPPPGPLGAPSPAPVWGPPSAAPAWGPPTAPAAPMTPGHGVAGPSGGMPPGPASPGMPPGQRPAGLPGPAGAPFGPPAGPVPARRAGRLRIGVAGLVAGALIGGGAGAGAATLLDEDPAGRPTGSAAQSVVIENPQTATTASAVAAKAAPSVVTVYVQDGSSAGSGSGVVLTPDGYVLTNNHVVAIGDDGGGAVQVRTADGTLYDAEIVGTDPSSDLAVLRLQGADGLTPAEFADSDEVQVGEVAVAIGAPLGLSNTVTDGIISATNRAVATGSTEDDATVIDAIQTDAAINPGNSGGALVDGAGRVIGINTAIATVASGSPGSSSQSGNIGVGFAIPSNTANRIAQEIVENGSATRAYLGVSARTAADGDNAEIGTGAEVVTVEQGSAAADAGLREGDVITAVGDRAVTTSTELTAAVRGAAPGDEIELTVQRGNGTDTVQVTLGETT